MNTSWEFKWHISGAAVLSSLHRREVEGHKDADPSEMCLRRVQGLGHGGAPRIPRNSACCRPPQSRHRLSLPYFYGTLCHSSLFRSDFVCVHIDISNLRCSSVDMVLQLWTSGSMYWNGNGGGSCSNAKKWLGSTGNRMLGDVGASKINLAPLCKITSITSTAFMSKLKELGHGGRLFWKWLHWSWLLNHIWAK